MSDCWTPTSICKCYGGGSETIYKDTDESADLYFGSSLTMIKWSSGGGDEFEEAKQMRYVTSIERLAQKRGREQGLEQGLEQGTKEGRQQAQREMILHILRFRFQIDPETTDSLLASLKLIEEEALLQRLIDHSLEATALSEFVANLKEEEAKLAQKDE